jgi:hypothetical protein
MKATAPTMSVRLFVSVGPKSRHALLSTILPRLGKPSTVVPSYAHARK